VGRSMVMEYTFNKHWRTFTPSCSYLPEILLNSVAVKASSLVNIFGTYIFADVFVMDIFCPYAFLLDCELLWQK
jgi:hypothetical protein